MQTIASTTNVNGAFQNINGMVGGKDGWQSSTGIWIVDSCSIIGTTTSVRSGSSIGLDVDFSRRATLFGFRHFVQLFCFKLLGFFYNTMIEEVYTVVSIK